MKLITEYTIYKEGENPIFSDGNIRIRLDDELAGMYLVIQQDNESIKNGENEIRIDFSEWNEVVEAVAMIRQQTGVL